MRPGLRKPLALLLTMLVTIPLLFTGAMLVKQKLLHFSREKRFEKERLETIQLLPAAMVWIKPGKELLLHGKPFDVKKTVQLGNRILVTGFFDEEEKDIYEQLIHTHSKKDQKPFPFASLVHLLQTPVHAGHSFLLPEPGWKPIGLSYRIFNEKIPLASSPAIDHPPA